VAFGILIVIYKKLMVLVCGAILPMVNMKDGQFPTHTKFAQLTVFAWQSPRPGLALSPGTTKCPQVFVVTFVNLCAIVVVVQWTLTVNMNTNDQLRDWLPLV